MIATSDAIQRRLLVARQFIRACRPPRVRSMREFAEQEIILPDGPHKGDRFKVERQPFAGLYFDEIDSGRWSRSAVTGPSQTGKSLIGYVIPGLYHLFELGETVICGLPSMDMAGDKWREDFLPAIEASRFKNLLPTRGQGSRGGAVEAVKFQNGATLKFMSGGGDDKKRAAFTARVLLVTEVDGMDTASGTSREADPIEQLVARTLAFGDSARVYLECTVSIERGRIWQEYTSGSASRIVLPCPHCKHLVTPDREHLKGWEDAEDVIGAEESAHLVCPDCGEPWSEEEREAANHSARLVHRDQEITPRGKITGSMPRTRTLGFRWTAANNLLAPIGLVGGEEWQAARSIDTANAERRMRQFRWAIPIEPDDSEVVSLSVRELCDRVSPATMGLIPAWADLLTMGVDCGQYLLHWVLLAGDVARQRHVQVVDYGVEEVHSRQFELSEALKLALGSLSGRASGADSGEGWPDEHGEARNPDLIWYDAGWQPVPVYQHCKAMGPRHWPAKGFGLGQYAGAKYTQPKTTGATTVAIYDGFHLAKIKHNVAGPVQLYEHNADLGKARVHDRLGMPMDEPGAILLPTVGRSVEHMTFAKHLLAEQLVEEDGLQKWRKTPGHGGHNHWLDAISLALMAMIRRWSQPKPIPRKSRPVITMPDGRPFVTQR